MKPIFTSLEIQPAFGAFGFSFLREPFLDEAPTRQTILYLRDADGFTTTALILAADVVRRSL